MRSKSIEPTLHQESPPAAAIPDFGPLARIYRWMEWFSFGPFLARCRCAFLNLLSNHSTALVLGDGDGRFTARLLRENPLITIDAVDASCAMLNELRRRIKSHSHRLQTHVSDARVFLPERRNYDLVVTHFFLDCLTTTEVESLARRLRSYARADAVWVLSDFAVPSGWYGRAVAQPVISFLYRSFGWLTGLEIRHLPNHHLALTRGGWFLGQQRKNLGGLLVSEIWHVRPRP